MNEPVILEKEQMILLGVSFFGDPFSQNAGWTEENEIGRLWNRYFGYLKKNKELFASFVNSKVSYEVHIEHEESARTGYFEVFVGMEIKNLDPAPYRLLVKVLPAATYAAFTLKGDQITSDWEITMKPWLDREGYVKAHSYGIQCYDERFKGVDKMSESELDVYIPVKRKDHE